MSPEHDLSFQNHPLSETPLCTHFPAHSAFPAGVRLHGNKTETWTVEGPQLTASHPKGARTPTNCLSRSPCCQAMGLRPDLPRAGSCSAPRNGKARSGDL